MSLNFVKLLSYCLKYQQLNVGPGSIAQSVASQIADPGIVSLIPTWSHTFMKIDHEIFSTVILLLPLIQEKVVSVKGKYEHEVLVYRLSQACPEKSVVRLTDHLGMTIAVDWDVKLQTKQN